MRLIDADALIESIKNTADLGGWIGEALYQIKQVAIKYIDSAPSIEPERGEWVPFEYGDDTWHKCSVCGTADKYIDKVPRPNGTIGTLIAVRNFCPTCGADMRERKESE